MKFFKKSFLNNQGEFNLPNKKELRYRNKVIRKYITNKNWEKNEEFNFIREFLKNYQDYNTYKDFFLPYKYVFNYEYDLGNFLNHKGDIILTDGRNNFIIAEFKIIWGGSSTKRTPKRKKLREQVITYMQFLNRDFPDASIIGLGITDARKPFYLEYLYYYDDEPEFFTNLPKIERFNVEKLPFIALSQYCKSQGCSDPTLTITINDDNSFSKKYKGQISLILNGEEYIEQKIGYNKLRIKTNLYANICKRLSIDFDKEYYKYYL